MPAGTAAGGCSSPPSTPRSGPWATSSSIQPTGRPRRISSSRRRRSIPRRNPLGLFLRNERRSAPHPGGLLVRDLVRRRQQLEPAHQRSIGRLRRSRTRREPSRLRRLPGTRRRRRPRPPDLDRLAQPRHAQGGDLRQNPHRLTAPSPLAAAPPRSPLRPGPGSRPHASQGFRGGGARAPARRAPLPAAHDVRCRTWRTVAAYHRAPPWAVGTPASFRSSAIFRSESPRARCR